MSEKNQNILNLTLDQVMSDRFGRYSKYIIQDRALPDSRDGLKPVQRRILYSMFDLGLHFNKPYKKSARVVGDVIGKYHPHGDSSIYEAMVRMSQNWKMNMPLVQMHGNNGSVDDDPAAAMRYTEARLAKLSHSLIDNLKKDTVIFAPNFDDSEKEPTVLPALFPNLLVNGAKGIAAGYATEIPPHNLSEIIDGLIAKIKKPTITLKGLLNYVKGPDFPTGGTIQGKDGIYEAFERGRGKIVIRSKYEIVDLKTKPSITITQIPYGVIKSKLVRDIDEIRFNNKISGIKDVQDQSDRNGISIFIELSPGANVQAVLNYLLSKTEMQIYYNYNVIAIKDRIPTQMGLIDLMDAYLNHQIHVQTKALKFDLKKNKTRLEIVEGLIKVAELADKIIDAIKKVKGSKSGVVKMLMDKFKFTQLQATAIAELRLYRLSQTDQTVYFKEKDELIETVAKIELLLKSKDDFDSYLIDQLKFIKKEFGQERKSDIEEADSIENISIDMESLIKHEDTWVSISKQGYIKRFSNRAYEANKFEDFGLKEDDSIEYLSLINTADKLLVFTNLGRYFYIPVHLTTESKFKEVGKHINDFGSLKHDEHIVDAISVEDFKLKGYIVQVTKNGRAKMTSISNFEVSRHKRAYKSFGLKAGDEVIGAKLSNGLQQIIIVNTEGKAVRYNVSEVPTQSTIASGAKCMNIKMHKASAFALANTTSTIGVISKRGGIKRIKVKDITPMAKSTQGKAMIRKLTGNPHIPIDMEVVDSNIEVIFFNKKMNIHKFKEVDITSVNEGMSLIGPAQPKAGKIMKFEKVNKDNPILAKQDDIPEEEKFEQAAKKIDEVGQISIDDILEKLK